MPDKPSFFIDRSESENGLGKAKVQWRPNVQGNPGSHFFVKYRKKGEPQWLNSDPQKNDDTTVVGSLEPETEYEFRVVSVDGTHETESDSLYFDASGGGKFCVFLLFWSNHK